MPSTPCAISAKVEKDKVVCTLIGDIPDFIVVKISGVRSGFSNIRFSESTEEEARLNDKFWSGTQPGGWYEKFLEQENQSPTPRGWLEDYLEE